MIGKSKGTAILSALFILSICALAAVAMAYRLQIDINRTGLLLNNFNLTQQSHMITLWAENKLEENVFLAENKNQSLDHTPSHFPLAKIDNIALEGKLLDAEGKFNLNNLTLNTQKNEDNFLAFGKLLKICDPTISQDQIDIILQAIKQKAKSHTPLFYAASELRVIKGMSANVMQKLSPFIIALPETTPLNINSASAEVMAAFSKTLTLEKAKAITVLREENKGYVTTQAFTNDPSILALNIGNLGYHQTLKGTQSRFGYTFTSEDGLYTVAYDVEYMEKLLKKLGFEVKIDDSNPYGYMIYAESPAPLSLNESSSSENSLEESKEEKKVAKRSSQDELRVSKLLTQVGSFKSPASDKEVTSMETSQNNAKALRQSL